MQGDSMALGSLGEHPRKICKWWMPLSRSARASQNRIRTLKHASRKYITALALVGFSGEVYPKSLPSNPMKDSTIHSEFKSTNYRLLLSFLDKAEPKVLHASCCRVCRKGKACGDSCISRSHKCQQPPGCACDG